jgi:hypothetical protein
MTKLPPVAKTLGVMLLDPGLAGLPDRPPAAVLDLVVGPAPHGLELLPLPGQGQALGEQAVTAWTDMVVRRSRD